jgi:hypothetical protein
MRVYRNVLSLLVPAVSIFLVTHANGQVQIQPVAFSGEYAPGTGEDATFSSGAGPIFGPPMINNRGEVAFWARYLTVSPPQSTGYGIWSGHPGALSLVARTGDAAPGLPFGTAFLNIDGAVKSRDAAIVLRDTVSNAWCSLLTGRKRTPFLLFAAPSTYGITPA